MMRDRSDDDVLPIGQDLLAEMLDVQRPSNMHALAPRKNWPSDHASASQATFHQLRAGRHARAAPPDEGVGRQDQGGV
jgi:hypothetical protein